MMFRLYAQVVSALDGGAGVGQLSHVPEAEAIAHFIGDFGARRVQKGFKVAVARGIALGVDADLVFALALMANVHKSRFGSRAVDMGFCLASGNSMGGTLSRVWTLSSLEETEASAGHLVIPMAEPCCRCGLSPP